MALTKAVARGEGVPNQPMLVIPGNVEFAANRDELVRPIGPMIDDLVRILAPGAGEEPGQAPAHEGDDDA